MSEILGANYNLRANYNSIINRHTSSEKILKLFEDESKQSIIVKLGGVEASFNKSTKEFALLEYLICHAREIKNCVRETDILVDLAITQKQFDEALSNIRKSFDRRDFEQFVIKINPLRSEGETGVKFYVAVAVPDVIKLI